MPTTNTNFTSLITAIDTKAQSLAASTTDPKDLVFLGKAVEALNVADTVSAIITEGDTQVAAVNTAGTTQVTAVTDEGTTQVAAVQAAGGSYATQANVDALISQVAVTVAASKFVIDGTSQKSVRLTPSVTYRFDTSDATNAGHPLKFSTTADGTHASGTEFTTGVTTVGTAGSANSYVQIIVEQDSPTLYYYCANHAAMGGTGYSAYDVLSTAPTDGQVLTYDAVSAAYVNRAAAAAGGMTLVDKVAFAPQTDASWSQTYSTVSVKKGGLRGNVFGGLHLYQKTNLGHTGVVGTVISVDRSTGAITTEQSPTQIWNNTSGSAISTIYFTTPHGTGGVFYGGHLAWPGQSSHYFGYGTAYINSSNNWVSVSTNATNSDHGYNGTWQTIPTDSTTGRIVTGGYNESDGSKAYYRINEFNGTSWSVGSNSSLGSDTSTTYGVKFISNSEATTTASSPVSAIEYRINGSNYRMKVINRSGQSHDESIPDWSNGVEAYQLTNGNTVFYSRYFAKIATAYNSLSDASERFPFNLTDSVGGPIHITGNTFIRSVVANDGEHGVAKYTINPTTAEVTVDEVVQLPAVSYYAKIYRTHFDVIFADDGTPTHLISGATNGYGSQYETYEWPFS